MRTLRFIKAYFLLSALLLWQCVFAEVVTERQARQRAADFFAAAEVKTKVSATRPDDFKLVGTFPEVSTKASPTSGPAMYIFDRPAGGYAIVSGDDVARPVLGYSLSGRFPITDIPDNLRALLQWYADIIDFARQQHWASSPMAAADGLDPDNTVKLQTALWNQHSPFNDLVAEVDGKKPPIGCVATAISIIMRYHKWPQRGTGNLPSYDYTYNGTKYHIDGYSLGYDYDWDKMPENYQDCSEEEAAQIARLLYDVAVMCKMAFRPGGSGSSINSAFCLPDFFDYDKQMVQIERGRSNSDAQWEQFIIDEINAGRPVLFSGTDREGHAFVIDGYNGRYFSVNYGWGGHTTYREGHNTTPEFIDFYTLTPIEGREQDLLVYNKYQSIVLRIMPDQDGTTDPYLALSVMDAPRIPFDFEINRDFWLKYGICNYSLTPFSRDFQYNLYNREGIVKESISSVFRASIAAQSGITAYTICRISKQLEEGDQILLCMKDPDSGQWTPIRQPKQHRIIFTTRPISELVSLEFVSDPQFPDTSSPEKKRDISVATYKDCMWEFWGNNNKKYVDNQWINGDHSEESVSWRSCLTDSEDMDCNTLLYEIWLPAGSYILRIHNPATGEIMNINLEL